MKKNEVADYLNNFEQRKKFIERIKNWATVFFFVSYAYFIYDKLTASMFTTHRCPQCNTAAAVDSTRFIYEHKLDSVIQTKQNKTKRK